MSKSVAALRGSEQMSERKDQAAQTKVAPKPVAQLKPRRKLAFALLIVFLLWIAILYWMYFTTVWGHAVR